VLPEVMAQVGGLVAEECLMKVSTRVVTKLALSSYIVTLAGCTPNAVGTPEPASAWSVEQMGDAESASPAEPVHFRDAGTEAPDTLGVKVLGAPDVRSATTSSYSASVGNAAGRRLYYWWFVAACAKGGGCAPSSYHLLDEGEGRSTVTLRFGAEAAEKDIVVQVAEIDGKGRTGSSQEFPVTGPAQRMGGGAEGFGGGVCDWYAGSFYPHTGRYTDPFTGRSWKRSFRRDYCGNRISWGPNPNGR
jgi:hypothetical protein